MPHGPPSRPFTCSDPVGVLISNLPADGVRPKVYAIRVSSIRQRDQIAPSVQVWSRSTQPWITHIGSMRKFDKQPQIDQTGKVSLT